MNIIMALFYSDARISRDLRASKCPAGGYMHRLVPRYPHGKPLRREVHVVIPCLNSYCVFKYNSRSTGLMVNLKLVLVFVRNGPLNAAVRLLE